MEVLNGALSTLERCVAVQVELSMTRLYQQAPSIETVIAWLTAHAFEPYWFLEGYKDSSIPRMLQVDGVFFRIGHGPRKH